MTTLSKQRLAFILAGFLLLEIALVLFVDKPLSLMVRQWDVQYPTLIAFFRFYTDVGLGQWYAWPSGIATLIGFGLLTTRRLPPPLHQRLLQKTQAVTFFFITTSAAGLLTDLFKIIISRARPKFLQHDIYGFHPFHPSGGWNSMPSGHSTTAFAVAFAILVLFPRVKAWPLAFGILIALSRIMINAHFLSDVLAGMIISWLTIILCEKYFVRKHWLPTHTKSIGMVNKP